jgi:class 3 adenylate cyclase
VTDLQHAPALPEGPVTIMFTDIEGSTEMIERLGDGDASLLVKEHNDIVRSHVAECGGYEVKFRGDGFMLAFTSAAKGVRCAIAIQEAMKEFAERHPEAPLGVCIGINSGEAVPDGDDFLGTAVNIAARLADSASGGEVMVSSVVRDLVAPAGEFKFLPEQEISLKGISEPQRVCLVAW